MGGQRRGCHVRRHAFALTQSSLDISRGGPARASVIKIFFKNRSGGSAQKIDDAFWGSNGARAHSAEPLSKMLRAMLQEPTSCIERAPMLCLSVCARGLGNVEGCFSPVAKIPISFAPWCTHPTRPSRAHVRIMVAKTYPPRAKLIGILGPRLPTGHRLGCRISKTPSKHS